jgi:hypothetical protein
MVLKNWGHNPIEKQKCSIHDWNTSHEPSHKFSNASFFEVGHCGGN